MYCKYLDFLKLYTWLYSKSSTCNENAKLSNINDEEKGFFCIEVMGLQIDRWPKQSRRHFGHPRMHSHQSGALGEVIKASTASALYGSTKSCWMLLCLSSVSSQMPVPTSHFPCRWGNTWSPSWHFHMPWDSAGAPSAAIKPAGDRPPGNVKFERSGSKPPDTQNVHILMPCKETDPKTSRTEQGNEGIWDEKLVLRGMRTKHETTRNTRYRDRETRFRRRRGTWTHYRCQNLKSKIERTTRDSCPDLLVNSPFYHP